MKPFFKRKKLLRTLDLWINCDSDVFLELGTNCPLLEHLKIFNLEQLLAAHIEAFLQGCTKLKTLELCLKYNQDTNVTKGMLIEDLGKFSPLLLESLILKVDSLGYFNTTVSRDISETALKSLAQGCPLLKILHIDDARILPAGVKHLVDYCPMLADITLTDCDISDNGLAELGKSKSLTRLNINYCIKITDAGIDALVKVNGCNILYLNIGCCFLLTDASLISIGKHCPNLTGICLTDCDGNNRTNMTFDGLMQLVEKNPKLTEYDRYLEDYHDEDDYNDDENDDVTENYGDGYADHDNDDGGYGSDF